MRNACFHSLQKIKNFFSILILSYILSKFIYIHAQNYGPGLQEFRPPRCTGVIPKL